MGLVNCTKGNFEVLDKLSKKIIYPSGKQRVNNFGGEMRGISIHTTKSGFMLAFFINGNFTLEIFKQKAWTEHLPLPKRHMYGICMVYLIFAYHVTYIIQIQ